MCNIGHYLISPENKNVQCEAGGVFNATNTSCESKDSVNIF